MTLSVEFSSYQLINFFNLLSTIFWNSTLASRPLDLAWIPVMISDNRSSLISSSCPRRPALKNTCRTIRETGRNMHVIHVICGEPQGLILGPIFFIYIYLLVTSFNVKMHLFRHPKDKTALEMRGLAAVLN